MHYLHVTLTDPPNHIQAAKGIRAAKFALGERLGMAEAARLVQDAERDGIVSLGQNADHDTIQAAMRVADDSGALRGFVDLTEDEYAELAKSARPTPPAKQPQPPRPTPSTPAFAVALQFMALTSGNPLVAAAHARRMGVNADESPFFEEVTQAIIGSFPWIEERLEEPLV